MADQIGRYEIRKELGRGGMATVYLAFDPRIKRQVAIKVLPRQFTHDPKYLARFQQEAQTIAALEHAAIVPIHDFGEHDDAPYLVMRYMSGGTLRDRLNGEPLSLEEIAAMLNRLAPALDYAHEVGVIHRDLKPANILFDHQGSPYLADFGIARLAEASQTMTMIGTPAYMSPEQVESQLKLDGRSDLYALGVMLYELLAGKPPYTAETPTGQMLMHITKPVPNVLEADRELPAGAQDVVNKAMAKDREERYQTAAELATAVHGLSSAEATPGADVALGVPFVAAAEEAAEKAPEPTVDDAPGKPEAAVAPQSEPDEAAAVVEETPAAGPPTSMEPVADVALEDGAEKVVLYTPPQKETGQPAEPVVATAAIGDSGAAPPADAGGEKGGGLPGWIWWVGALVLVAIAAFGIRAVLSGGDGQEDTAAEPAEEPAEAPEPTETPTEEPSPTPTADPKLAPLGSEVGNTWKRPADGMTMVYVPEGAFPMGSEDGNDDEKSVHDVSLDAFWIDHTEVTNAQYALCVSDGSCDRSDYTNDSDYNGDDYAVVGVSWHDADNYCAWADARLPSEAEWEYAARGPEGSKYPWGSEAPNCDLAQFKDCDGSTVPVGSYPAGESWSGALDMAGSVWEWVNDWYVNDYYANSPEDNPQGPNSGELKVLRGGSWSNLEFDLRGAYRNADNPDLRFDDVGIRCVVSPGS